MEFVVHATSYCTREERQAYDVSTRASKALGEDSLTQDDWDVLRLTADFLQPFWQATLAQQKKWSSLDQLLYHMDILLKHFEDAKVYIHFDLVYHDA
jgi:hypothetical protein